jgi:anthranilate phosphoribosyltransferase
MQQYLKIVGNGRRTARDLTCEEAEAACTLIMEGQASLPQVAAFMAALRIKEESGTELTAFTRVVRRYSQHLPAAHAHGIDICIPYDGRSKTSILLVASAIITATCGAYVGLHGRVEQATPPKFGLGIGDVLAALGIPINLSLDTAAEMLNDTHLAFVSCAHFAPRLEQFNPVRLDFGMRSFFNTVEKLLNPFGMPSAMVGVFHYPVMQRVIETLQQVGYRRGLAVQGSEGSIEVLTSRRTPILEFNQNTDGLQEYAIDPHMFDWWESALDQTPLTAEDQATLTLQILDPSSNIASYYRQSAALTAGLMLYSANISAMLAEGVTQARAALKGGAAHHHLAGLKKEAHYA